MSLIEIGKKYPSSKNISGFIQLYEKHFAHLKESKINILEIGVDNGDSLRIWREYFSQANICGIDIDKKDFKIKNVSILQGDQSDKSFLESLIRIYEKKYLGPLYYDFKGPPVLLILPKTETHSLGIITASMIMKKNGVNPFLALGYSKSKLADLINSIDFRLFGVSVSCDTNIDECIELSKFLRKIQPNTPRVLGSKFEFSKENKLIIKDLFTKITSDPVEAIKSLV